MRLLPSRLGSKNLARDLSTLSTAVDSDDDDRVKPLLNTVISKEPEERL